MTLKTSRQKYLNSPWIIIIGYSWNHCGKRRNCSFRVLTSPSPSYFQSGHSEQFLLLLKYFQLYSTFIKSSTADLLYVGKGYHELVKHARTLYYIKTTRNTYIMPNLIWLCSLHCLTINYTGFHETSIEPFPFGSLSWMCWLVFLHKVGLSGALVKLTAQTPARNTLI